MKTRSIQSEVLRLMMMATLVVGLLFSGATGAPGFLGFGDADETLVEMSAVFSTSAASPSGSYQAVAIVDIAQSWHINSVTPYQDFLIPAEISLDTTDGLLPHSLIIPEGHDVLLAGENMSVYDGRVLFQFMIDIGETVEPGEYQVPVELTYQACNDRECRPPLTVSADLKVVVGTEGQPMRPDLFATTEVVSDSEDIEIPVEEPTELERLINDYGIWGYFMALGLAFVTGLLLSFSPCTYPMIPITVSIFAGQQRSVGKGFVMSLFYVGSMAFMYGLMGLVVSLVGGVFGAWLASPAVVVGIAIVFVLFALSMFGLYDLNLPYALRQKLGTTKGGGGYTGAIVLGIIAALVVSPCVGPFVAGILLYVATYGSPLFGFIVLFVFAVGLGTLYILIGTFSSAINKLPGSGGWMESVKKFFGFVLLLMAVYFLQTIIPEWLSATLMGLLLIGFGVFGGGLDRLSKESTFFDRLKKFVGLIAFIVGLYTLLGTLFAQGLIAPPSSEWMGTSGQSVEQKEHINWQTDLEAGLAEALRDGKPVLIDTWATWCVNCRVLDRETFAKDVIIEESRRFLPLKIQLETASSDITQTFMKRFGMKHYSLPTTLLLDSEGKLRKRFQGVVTPEELLAEMKKIR